MKSGRLCAKKKRRCLNESGEIRPHSSGEFPYQVLVTNVSLASNPCSRSGTPSLYVNHVFGCPAQGSILRGELLISAIVLLLEKKRGKGGRNLLKKPALILSSTVESFYQRLQSSCDRKKWVVELRPLCSPLCQPHLTANTQQGRSIGGLYMDSRLTPT